MIDSASAVQAAAYGALNGASAVTDLCDVWGDAPPEDTQPPVAMIDPAGMTVEPIGGKDGGLDRVEFAVLAYVRTNKADLSALQAAIRNVIEDQAITATGAQLSRPVHLSTEGGLGEDGVTYEGMQRFETIVQPA